MRSSVRRAVLGTLGALALFGPAVFSGCAVSFSPPGKVNSLRVISVATDKPYIEPIPADECEADPDKCTVHFKMDLYDGSGLDRRINILWIGGCFNPDGDQYSLCLFPAIEIYNQYKDQLEIVKEGGIPELPEGVPFGFGPEFSLVVPDIVSSREAPKFGPHYGIGYVFFLACAGYFDIIEENPSAASNFPIGCFDRETKQPLGPDSYVPGYTQIYSFADGRQNGLPPVTGITLDGEVMPEGEPDAGAELITVPRCDVPPDERNQPPSCSREDPFTACTAYEIQVEVPENVAEVDPDAKGSDGEPLTETVWVNYLSDNGDFDGDIKLINDPQTGYQKEHKVMWLPPAEPGVARIWAVVRDARGGSTTVVRYVNVE